MNEYALNRLIDARETMQELSRNLRSKAYSLSDIGMEGLAENLFRAANDLDDAVRALNDGKDAAIQQAVRVSEEATANMVGAAVAMLNA